MMKNEDLFNNNRINEYDNTMLKDSSRYDNLPSYSLRVRGETHTKVHAIKKICLYDNIDEVLDKALEKMISELPKHDIEKIRNTEYEENEQKLKRVNKKKK